MPAPVAIIGTGHVGCSLAVDLLHRHQRDIRVIMWAHVDHRSMFDTIFEDRKLETSADSVISGTYHPELTRDLGDCIRTARTLVITVPASGHMDIIDKLKAYDLSEHTLVVIPGTFFSYVARNAGISAKRILETATSPYGCRILNDNTVFVKSIKTVLQIAASVPFQNEAERAAIAEIFPRPLEWHEQVLKVAFMCTNGIGHPPAVIMNAGRIESTKGDFHFYGEGMTETVGNVTEALDAERLKVAERYGFTVPTMLSVLNRWYNMNAKTFAEFARTSIPHNQTKGAPTNMQHRYITEDIPCWLVPVAQLGKKGGIPTPIADAIIHLASAGNLTDYIGKGRNLAALGIENCTVEDIIELFA